MANSKTENLTKVSSWASRTVQGLHINACMRELLRRLEDKTELEDSEEQGKAEEENMEELAAKEDKEKSSKEEEKRERKEEEKEKDDEAQEFDDHQVDPYHGEDQQLPGEDARF